MRTAFAAISLALLFLGLQGCTGYNRLLFVTKTNVGMDVDTTPPTAEITIARREGVIAPSFEGRVPPLAASFRKEGGFFNPRISAIFTGGDAAVVVSDLFDSSTTTPSTTDGSLCLREEPVIRRWWRFWTKDKISTIRKGEIRPFFFGTDTSFGLKVAWSGTTSAIPDTVKLGYNRKEFALAPLSGRKTACKLPEDGQNAKNGTFQIEVPSFLASVDNSVELGKINDSELKQVQFFATGGAATKLAEKPAVRKVLTQQLAPQVAALESQARRRSNRELITAVNVPFKLAGDPDKNKIREKAIALGVVTDDTTNRNFRGRLAANEGASEAMKDKLEQLRGFVQGL